ncbi:MAG: hypothetical protein ABI689_12845 [Thermoanaerobaculia bacterium]
MRALPLRLAALGLSLTLAPAAWAGEFRLEKHLPIAAGGSFTIASEAGGIDIRGGDGTEAVVVVTSNREDFAEVFNLRFATPAPDRAEVVIERKSHGPGSWFEGGHRTRITVTLPKSVATKVSSSGGGIDIAGVDGKVTAESSGGGVQASHLGGAANLSSSGGSISADDVAGDLEAESSGGGVDIREARGAVVAESSGGAVSVGFAAGNARGGNLSSSGGGVEARVDPAVGLEIDASSSGGAVDCALPLTVRGKIGRDDVHGTLNGGGALLKLRSSGGGIDIGKR